MAGESARTVAIAKRATAERLLRSADAFELGAAGEVATAQALTELPDLEWRVFHDVRWPGRRFANIDHVLVGPQGVFVIDTKAWTGHIDVRAGALRQNGHRRMKTVASAWEAAAVVRDLLPEVDPDTVKPVLCFARVMPVFGWVDDLMLCSTQNVVSLLSSRPKVLDEVEVLTTAESLAQSLKSATGLAPRVASTVRGRRTTTRSRNTSLAKSLIGATLVAVLVLLGLRLDVLHRLGDLSGQTIVGIVAPSEPLGETQGVEGGAIRPQLDVTATNMVVTQSQNPGMRAARGQVLVAVELTVRNMGTQMWVSEPGTSVVLRDEVTASYRTATEFTKVGAGRVLPAVIRLRPGKQARGFMVFEVPRSTTINQIELSVGPTDPETVRWSVG